METAYKYRRIGQNLVASASKLQEFFFSPLFIDVHVFPVTLYQYVGSWALSINLLQELSSKH